MAFPPRKSIGNISVLLLVASAAMVVTIAPAEAQQGRVVVLETKAFTWPWPFPSPSDPEIQKCWASLMNVQGCVQEIFKSYFTHNISLGPACCTSISQLSDYCAPKIFAWGPFSNSFLSLVKGYCVSIGAGPSPLSPVQAPPPEKGNLAPTPMSSTEPSQEQGIQPPTTGPGYAEYLNGGSAPEPYESFEPSPIDGETF